MHQRTLSVSTSVDGLVQGLYVCCHIRSVSEDTASDSHQGVPTSGESMAAQAAQAYWER